MEIEAKGIHHLGIVSGICDEIGLVDIIDKEISSHSNMKLTIGQRIKAMILNGLGFTSKPLYLTPEFFRNKAIQQLMGAGIESDNLNDDSLGRALDEIYQYGAEALFTKVASSATKRYEIDTKVKQLDTTSMGVEGDYKDEDNTGIIRFGHSKDMRSDLKQFILSYMCTNKGGIPLMFSVVPGNTSDAIHLRETVQTLQENMVDGNEEMFVIFDAAGYNKEMVASIDRIFWISRVPDTITEAKKLKDTVRKDQFADIGNGYSIFETSSHYGGREQRWLVVHSKQAYERDKKTLQQKINRERDAVNAEIRLLSRKQFSCRADSEEAVIALQKKIKFHTIKIIESNETKHFLKKGKPKTGDQYKLLYTPSIEITEKIDLFEELSESNGKFILATNCLDREMLLSEKILSTYKEQHQVEKGFRFLKSPLCMAESVFLKNQNRIIALSAIMFLCLLVYAIAEYVLRQALVQSNKTVKNQVKKNVQNPTMRWIFQLMEDIILIRYIKDNKIIMEIVNMSNDIKTVLQLLGSLCMEKYLMIVQT